LVSNHQWGQATSITRFVAHHFQERARESDRATQPGNRWCMDCRPVILGGRRGHSSNYGLQSRPQLRIAILVGFGLRKYHAERVTGR
jgi:hypothetical protein